MPSGHYPGYHSQFSAMSGRMSYSGTPRNLVVLQKEQQLDLLFSLLAFLFYQKDLPVFL
jgi:hypothetical protein